MMPTRKFEASLRRNGEIAILDLSGEIDSSAELELDTAFTAAEQTNAPVIILNFRAVSYINSTGIALIVALLARTRKANRRLNAFGLTEHYTMLFNITRLSEYINVFTDEQSALADTSTVSQSSSGTR